MKITIVSPSNRTGGLNIVGMCLKNQTMQDFEWLICSPKKEPQPISYNHFLEPEKKKGTFYSLNAAWNKLINQAKGELVVFIVDYTEFPPNALEILWKHYVDTPTSCVSGIGYQFNDKNELVWKDPRFQPKELFPIMPIDMELRLASIPRRAIQAVGGFDEEYDKVVANSEKEMCYRILTLGYIFVIDQRITYKFYKHEDHGKEWDRLYKESVKLMNKDVDEIRLGKRLRLNYVQR